MTDPAAVPAAEPTAPAVEPIVEKILADAAPADPVVPDTPVVPEADTTVPVKTETPADDAGTPSDWTPVEEDIKLNGMKYGDLQVEVTIPSDVANYAGEKGIDAAAVSKELYGSEDFTLSEETLNGLYEAFPKWQVDAYLSGIKAKNDAMSSQYKTEAETTSANQKAAWDSTLEIMGGEDRWADMSAYAVAKLSEGELTEFNTVMADGSLYMQQLMIKDLYGKFSADGAPVAPVILDLEDGQNGGDGGGKVESALTAAAYLNLIKTGEYKNDPAKYDALRRAGLNKGI